MSFTEYQPTKSDIISVVSAKYDNKIKQKWISNLWLKAAWEPLTSEASLSDQLQYQLLKTLLNGVSFYIHLYPHTTDKFICDILTLVHPYANMGHTGQKMLVQNTHPLWTAHLLLQFLHHWLLAKYLSYSWAILMHCQLQLLNLPEHTLLVHSCPVCMPL